MTGISHHSKSSRRIPVAVYYTIVNVNQDIYSLYPYHQLHPPWYNDILVLWEHHRIELSVIHKNNARPQAYKSSYHKPLSASHQSSLSHNTNHHYHHISHHYHTKQHQYHINHMHITPLTCRTGDMKADPLRLLLSSGLSKRSAARSAAARIKDNESAWLLAHWSHAFTWEGGG